MEHIRERKITIYIDTNKRTIEQTFEGSDCVEKAIAFYEEIVERIEE